MELPSPSSPSSTEVSPIQLKDCLEELLRFTLLSSIQAKVNTGLSNEYCANLLIDDSPTPFVTHGECKGVPSYPLYKHLESSLYNCIHYGALSTTHKEFIPYCEDQSSKKKVHEWINMILEKAAILQTILKKVDFELHVQEPFFSQLNDGTKTIEGRCATDNYKRIQSGHLLLFNKCTILGVQGIRTYTSFREMLELEGIEKVLPGVRSVEEGVQIYRNFYSEDKERSNGVLALCVEPPPHPLYVVMASILAGLSYAGIQKLLGFVETPGTNLELLPPPRSTLLSAFSAPQNPDVKSSTLTNGARSLAKHVNRSMERYWGAFHGSDSDKNRHAMDVIEWLLSNCCWLNMHIVPPHGTVFEIRGEDGYGARWSADGTKFIGFLEPYMVEGSANHWKH